MMPRPGPRRPVTALRLSAEGLAHIDRQALAEGLTIRDGNPNRSEMIRLMLAYASARMPQGWRPESADLKHDAADNRARGCGVNTDLEVWLRSQLDADEKIAAACIEEIGAERAGDPLSDGSGLADHDAFPSYPWGSRDAELAFFRIVQPAHVLRTVAAHRAILALHGPHPHYSGTCVADAGAVSCGCVSGPCTEWPCETARWLVSIYADRPGYDPSWRS